jgi:hypothetical protein
MQISCGVHPEVPEGSRVRADSAGVEARDRGVSRAKRVSGEGGHLMAGWIRSKFERDHKGTPWCSKNLAMPCAQNPGAWAKAASPHGS